MHGFEVAGAGNGMHVLRHRASPRPYYRFAKQVLGWTTPKVRTPEQADRWTWLVIAAYTQLRLARHHVDDPRLPWQPPLPADKRTPGRVRRGYGHLLARIGSPAKPPKPRGRPPGRPRGRRSAPAPRCPAIKKQARVEGCRNARIQRHGRVIRYQQTTPPNSARK